MRSRAIRAPLIVITLGLLWFFRSWFHDPLLWLYSRPEAVQAVVLGVLIWVFLLPRIRPLTRIRRLVTTTTTPAGPKQTEVSFRWLHVAGAVTTILLLVVLLLFGGWFRADHLARTLDYHRLDQLPEAVDNVRLMPYEVARRYAMDSLQLSQYRLGTESMIMQDDALTWVFPLTPDGLLIKFLLQNKGVTLVDATTQDRNSRMVWQDMRIGEGMQLTDNLWWNLYRVRYWVTTEYPFYVAHDGNIHTAVPAIEYTYHCRWGIVYTVPRFAGIFLVDTEGRIEFITPPAAAAHPVLEGNRIFPEHLARQYVNAYQYHLGILNRLFIHEDQIQIQDVSGARRVNRQPYLMMTADGLKWFVSTEPFGASHGIFKIFLVDVTTGRIELYELPQDETLTGPIRAMDYVRRANPVVDWSRFQLSEPLPFVRDGELHWKIAVVPADAAGIAYQAFVDSRTNQVVEVRTDDEILAFIRGEEIAAPSAEGDRDEILEEIQLLLNRLEELVQYLADLD